MGAGVSLSPFARPAPPAASSLPTRRSSLVIDATGIRAALLEAGEKGERIEMLSEKLTDYLRRQGSTNRVDDATLYTLGVARQTVRMRLLERLAGLGPLRYREEDENNPPSGVREEKATGEEEKGYDDYDDDDEDHYYSDDFEGPATDSGDVSSSLSPLSQWVGMRGKASSTHGNADGRANAYSPARPEVVIPAAVSRAGDPIPMTGAEGGLATSQTKVNLPTSPAPSIGSSGGSSSGTRTTRSTPLASPPSQMDSRGPTPVTSPANPMRGKVTAARAGGGGGGGGILSPSGSNYSKGAASAATRKTAEALSNRLKEDRQLRSPAADKRSSMTTRIRPGHWKLGNKIGKGSFGQVYVGLNEDTGQFVAVKALPIGGQETDAHNLYQEIELMRKLEHPNIVRYLGAQVDVGDGKLFIFQEWMAGGSVSSMIEKFGPLKPPAIRKYTIQLLQGLDYLHDHHIIHRDIKGGNLLVDDKGTVKLADFGASKQLGLSGSADDLSQTLKGTPYFMAPEVLMESHYGRKSDIWSVGGAILQMLTGEPPWKSMNFVSAVALMYHISHTEDPPPLPDRVPPLLLGLILRCFDRNPSTRPGARDLLSHPFLTQEDDEEDGGEDEEEGEGGIEGDGMAADGGEMGRTGSDDYSPVQGEFSDWGQQRRTRGGIGEDMGTASSGGEDEEDEETFELLARAIDSRNGQGA